MNQVFCFRVASKNCLDDRRKLPIILTNLAYMSRCRKCGGYQHDPMRFGSGRLGPACTCPTRERSSGTRSSSSRSKSKLSTVEQLALLTKLYQDGAITEGEFRQLKAQLIAHGDA